MSKENLYISDWCKLDAEIVDELVFIHLSVYKWNKTKYKLLKTIWSTINKNLAENNIDRVFSLIPKTDKKALKFQTKFGMEEVASLDEHVLFCKETS